MYRPGGSGSLAKRGLEDGRGGDFVEGKIFGGAAGALLPGEEEAAVAVCEAGGGIDAELEGPPAWIDDTLTQLGVDPATCLTDSYGSLFLAWKQRTGSPADHLTFDEIPASARLQPASL